MPLSKIKKTKDFRLEKQPKGRLVIDCPLAVTDLEDFKRVLGVLQVAGYRILEWGESAAGQRAHVLLQWIRPVRQSFTVSFEVDFEITEVDFTAMLVGMFRERQLRSCSVSSVEVTEIES